MCNSPDEITPEDLLAFVDGDAPADVAEHVRQCRHCSAEVERYARAQSQLRQGLYRFDCPSPQTLGEYQLGLLSPEERQRTAAHVVDCPHCAAEIRSLNAFLADEVVPSPTLIERLRRVVATLVSPAARPAVSLRGAAETGARTYRTGEVTVNLRVEAAGRGRYLVVGLVDRTSPEIRDDPGLAGRAVRLIASGGDVTATQIDIVGGFDIEEISAGPYQMEIALDDQVVVIEGLEIG
jgi:hypothetical protein